MSETSDATPKCPYCGQHHIGLGMCPHVRAVEYHPDGTIKRVEFVGAPQYITVPAYPPAEWPAPYWQRPYITSTGGTATIFS